MRPVRWALRRIRLFVAIGALLLALAGIDLVGRTAPVYAENATIVFTTPATENSEVAYTEQAPALIASASLLTEFIMSPESESHIKAAGGTAYYTMTLVNLYNQEYPDYSYPEAALSVSSPRQAATRRTFLLAVRTLDAALARRQRAPGVRPADRIVARVLGDPGPVETRGSKKRAAAGIALLAIVAGSWASGAAGRQAERRLSTPSAAR